jgi:hypothetical protein
MAWGTLVAALTVAAWAPRPAAGQQPEAPIPVIVTTPSIAPAGPDGPAASPFTGHVPGGQGMAPTSNFRAAQDQIAKLAQQYAKATGEDEKKDVRKKLSDALGQQFDLLAERQKKELEDLEKQVADLRALLKKRQDNRGTIINRRLEQVLQDAEGLGWHTDSAAPRSFYYGTQPNRH